MDALQLVPVYSWDFVGGYDPSDVVCALRSSIAVGVDLETSLRRRSAQFSIQSRFSPALVRGVTVGMGRRFWRSSMAPYKARLRKDMKALAAMEQS